MKVPEGWLREIVAPGIQRKYLCCTVYTKLKATGGAKYGYPLHRGRLITAQIGSSIAQARSSAAMKRPLATFGSPID